LPAYRARCRENPARSHSHGGTIAMNTTDRRLARSRRDRKIAGVCGGIAEHFGWDPTVVRLVVILSILLPGPQVLAYLLAWIVMPEDDELG
jgi:phage shock protein C